MRIFSCLTKIIFIGIFFWLGQTTFIMAYQQLKMNNFNKNFSLNFESTFTLAADAPARWGFVKQSVTWAQSNTTILRVIVEPIVTSKILETSTVYTRTSDDGLWIWRISPNVNESHTSTAYSGAQEFNHKFEVWRASDNEKAMEIFFTAPTNLAESSLLLLYRLSVLDPITFDGDDTVTESYTFGTANARKQTYTITGGSPKANMSGIDKGRVILEEMDSGTILCVKSVVRLKSGSDICSGGNQDYYSLAYSQNLTGDKEVTAKFGLLDGDIDGNGELCSGVSNPYKFGMFSESQSFISDANNAADVSSSHPSPTRVDALFAELGTTGDGDYDDTSFSTVDAWDIQMKSLTAP